MSDTDPNGLAATLLSVSFVPALLVGAIAGRLGGTLIGAGAGALVVSGFSSAAAWLTWRAGPLAMEPDKHRGFLIACLLFAGVPLLMSSVLFTAAWETASGWAPEPRLPGTIKACRVANIVANLGLLYGCYVTFWDSSVASAGAGFPILGASAIAHALIGVVAGRRPSVVLTALVVGVGFCGFGLLAGTAGL